MESPEDANILSRQTFESVLEGSPFADRSERIRDTLREVHHQYLELKLTGNRTGPQVDYSLLEETAYYLSGVATTPGRSEKLSASLRSQMVSVAGLIFEYLGDISSADANSNIDDKQLYYLDACICNSLGLYEANTIALANKFLFKQEIVDSELRDTDPKIIRDVCQQVVFAWLARDMIFLWTRRLKIEKLIKNALVSLDSELTKERVSRVTYREIRYWVLIAESIVSHSRFFQFGKTDYLEFSREKFTEAIQQGKRNQNPPLVWIAFSLQTIAEMMSKNSVWQRLSKVCPPRYLRRLVTSSPPVLELWSSQIKALESITKTADNDKPVSLDHGILDPLVRRVVIGMPTSAGKTLLAELVIIRTLFPDLKNYKPIPDVTCVYVVPSLALVNQIEAKLSNRLLPLGIRVTAILGGYDTAQLDDILFGQLRIAVVTPEKLDMLVRQDHPFIQRCQLYVFDEVHKLDNIGRGWTMEALITWLKDFHPTGKLSKMLFMSAVMPNFMEIEMWIQEKDAPIGSIPVLTVSESWQPTRQIRGYLEVDKNDVMLKNQLNPKQIETWYGGHINYIHDRSDLAQPRQIRRLIEVKEVTKLVTKRKTGQLSREKDSAKSFGPEEIAGEIAKKYLNAKLDPVLVFFVSRAETRKFCKYLSSEDYSPKELPLREQNQYRMFIQYLEERLGEKHPLCEYVKKGIAYHHGWLPRDVRAEIEYAISRQWLRVIACTTTLADGVNFPIVTFILATYEQVIGTQEHKPIFFHLEKKDFQNIVGRAGRAIYDTEGQIVFVIPPKYLDTDWKDYLFPDPEDWESRISSSLGRQNFRRDILEKILSALEDPNAGAHALFIDPDKLDELYGNGAKGVGETVLRLQAFLLSLMNTQILDPENIVTIQKFFNQTLFGKQHPDDKLFELIIHFTQVTGQAITKFEPDQKKRAFFGMAGLGFESCRAIFYYVQDYWNNIAKLTYEENVEHITPDFLYSLSNALLSLPEVRPEQVKVPHKKPVVIIGLSVGELLVDWVINSSTFSQISDKYFSLITDPAEKAESCANFIRDTFEYKTPWAISAFNLFLGKIAQEEGIGSLNNTNLGQQMSLLPAYIKFGVKTPAAAFFSMVGIKTRRTAIFLGDHFNQENPGREYDYTLIFDWLLGLEPERVNEWIAGELGEDKTGQISRLFRFLEVLRGQEQILEDISPLEVHVAGWQYYKGNQVIEKLRESEEVLLKLDPLNPWDSYAVEIFNRQNQKLGHIPKAYSRIVFNHLVNDLPLNAVIVSIDRTSKFDPVKLRLTTLET
jgi:helicase